MPSLKSSTGFNLIRECTFSISDSIVHLTITVLLLPYFALPADCSLACILPFFNLKKGQDPLGGRRSQKPQIPLSTPLNETLAVMNKFDDDSAHRVSTLLSLNYQMD